MVVSSAWFDGSSSMAASSMAAMMISMAAQVEISYMVVVAMIILMAVQVMI